MIYAAHLVVRRGDKWTVTPPLPERFDKMCTMWLRHAAVGTDGAVYYTGTDHFALLLLVEPEKPPASGQVLRGVAPGACFEARHELKYFVKHDFDLSGYVVLRSFDILVPRDGTISWEEIELRQILEGTALSRYEADALARRFRLPVIAPV
ncbi:MAG: hypothetical protein ACP5I3_12270 [Thermoproteus sp.]